MSRKEWQEKERTEKIKMRTMKTSLQEKVASQKGFKWALRQPNAFFLTNGK